MQGKRRIFVCLVDESREAHRVWQDTSGPDGKSTAVRGTFDQSASYRRLDVVARNGASSRARMCRVPARIPAGNYWRAKASAALPATRESAAQTAIPD